VGTTGQLPFGGLKKSGNHRPASVFASLYCTYPAAIHRGEPTLDPAKRVAGIHWE
jgi:succinylglutamic semialdehyde dehydrogenase